MSTFEAAPAARHRSIALAVLVIALAAQSAMILNLLDLQPAGADFSCFWAGGRTALSDPGRIYDFAYISELQGWPLGPGAIRPFIYPPSALLIMAPLGALPYWPAYAIWATGTAGFFLWAAQRARMPWWTLTVPAVALVVYCGQITLLIGGLVLAGLALRPRALLAGVLFGVAAALKPQMVVFAPLALLAEGRWKTLTSAGLTGLALVGVSVGVWGAPTWLDWLEALPRFQQDVIFANPSLVADAITPYTALTRLGLPGAWAFLLAPIAALGVWIAFRRTEDLADRLIAVFGAALVASPYAMNYEAALLAPAVAAYMARKADRLWPLYLILAIVYVSAISLGFVAIAAALALPVARLYERRLAPPATVSASSSP